jgi:hypothetical protein
MEIPMTYMWQEQRGEMFFRFQTDEPIVAEKMRRRVKFKLTGQGMTCKFWIYIAGFYSPQKARGALAQLTGRKVKKDSSEDMYYA